MSSAMPLRYRMVLWLIAVALTAFSLMMLANEEETNLLVFICTAIAVLTIIAVSLMKCRITFLEQWMEVRLLRFIRTEIAYQKITDVEAFQTGFWQGMGVRLLRDGSIGYIVGGTAVRMTVGNRPVIVSTSNPQQVIAELTQRANLR
jgi:hypothetical protein